MPRRKSAASLCLVITLAAQQCAAAETRVTIDTSRRDFNAPGIYHYFCSLHAHMQGTIVVR